MIILAGTMTFDPAALAELVSAIRAMVETVRAEDGCLHYSLLVEDEASGLVNATEIWRDESALRLHLAQPLITDFLHRFSSALKMIDIRIYDVSGSRPLVL